MNQWVLVAGAEAFGPFDSEADASKYAAYLCLGDDWDAREMQSPAEDGDR